MPYDILNKYPPPHTKKNKGTTGSLLTAYTGSALSRYEQCLCTTQMYKAQNLRCSDMLPDSLNLFDAGCISVFLLDTYGSI